MSSVKKQSGATKNAVIYIRVSTEDQKQGLSLEVQEKLCRKRAEEEDLRVIEVLDDGGISGHKEDRPGINRIRELVSEKKIQAVIALSSDRLFRNTQAHLGMMNLFLNHGIRVIYTSQASPEDNAVSKFSDTMLAGVHEFYRNQISDKVKGTLYAKAQAGYYPTRPPIGYINAENPDKGAGRLARKIIVRDPEMGPLIQELFNQYATGLYSVYDLVGLLIQKGLRSHAGFKPSHSRIYDLLRNRVYLGEVHWGPVALKEGKHEPLVDEATFNRVQSILETNNHKACRRRKYQWLLSGFVYCSNHLKRFVAEWHHSKGVAYYHCSNKTGCGKYCEHTDLEAKVADKFKDLQFSDEFVELVIDKAKRLYHSNTAKYDARRQGLINRKTALEGKRKVAEDKLFRGIISDDDFSRVRAELKEDIDAIDAELIDLKDKREVDIDVAQEILLLARNIYKAYKKASHNLKRQYLGFFWERFEVLDGVIVKSVPTPLFRELMRVEGVFYKNSKTEESPETKGISAGILTTNLLLG